MPAFLLLGVIWAAVLLPPWLQSRREARPTASMVTFRRQLWSLARTSPGYGPVYTDTFNGYEDDGYGDLTDDVDDVDGGASGRADELAHRRALAPTASRQHLSSQRLRRVGGSYRRRRHILT
ncbi:MAG: hypothetical protein ACRD0W_07340, partial [Acidimicrobiales bacterium]